MSSLPALGSAPLDKGPRQLTGSHHRNSQRGESYLWLSGGATVLCLAMVLGLIAIVVWNGAGTFWPKPVRLIPLRNGELRLGEYYYSESFEIEPNQIPLLSPLAQRWAERELKGNESIQSNRHFLQVGASEAIGKQYSFVSDPESLSLDPFEPEAAWVVERSSRGPVIGFPVALLIDLDTAQRQGLAGEIQNSVDSIDLALEKMETTLSKLLLQYRTFEKGIESLDNQLGLLDRSLQKLNLAIRQVEIETGSNLRPNVESIANLLDLKAEESFRHDATLQSLSSLSNAIDSPMTSPDVRDVLEGLFNKERDDHEERINALDQELEDRHRLLNQLPGSNDHRIQSYLSRWQEIAYQRLEIHNRLTFERAQSLKSKLVLAIARPEESLVCSDEEWNAFVESDRIPLYARDASPIRSHTIVSGKGFKLLQLETPTGYEYYWGNSLTDLSPTISRLSHLEIPLSKIVRAYRPNRLSLLGKCSLFQSRWWEFVSQNPRKANTEGGIFPAIWGTIVLTLTMSVLVIPFGVMAALFLAEYSTPGPLTSLVRISINNLAGVPSIVYGVFGLAFFCYGVGAYIDGGPTRVPFAPLPPPTWFALFAATASFGTIAFLSGIRKQNGTGTISKGDRLRRYVASFCWIACLVGVAFLFAKTPFFQGFYRSSLPSATFGHRGILWASMTMALLTLPVVIVATEEAISAVPRSLREGSYACGASQWQTVLHVVLPHARSGILTGSILAVARGTGEVAPLMLVGALPSAMDLPVDFEFPFYHGSRGFMHLGYQIFTSGFQGQNSDASRPMVFTITILLIAIVTLLNLLAIWMRARARNSHSEIGF